MPSSAKRIATTRWQGAESSTVTRLGRLHAVGTGPSFQERPANPGAAGGAPAGCASVPGTHTHTQPSASITQKRGTSAPLGQSSAADHLPARRWTSRGTHASPTTAAPRPRTLHQIDELAGRPDPCLGRQVDQMALLVMLVVVDTRSGW